MAIVATTGSGVGNNAISTTVTLPEGATTLLLAIGMDHGTALPQPYFGGIAMTQTHYWLDGAQLRSYELLDISGRANDVLSVGWGSQDEHYAWAALAGDGEIVRLDSQSSSGVYTDTIPDPELDGSYEAFLWAAGASGSNGAGMAPFNGETMIKSGNLSGPIVASGSFAAGYLNGLTEQGVHGFTGGGGTKSIFLGAYGYAAGGSKKRGCALFIMPGL